MNIMRRVCGAMRPELTVLTAAALLAFGIARAQGTEGNGTAKPQMMAKDADPDWEVATVYGRAIWMTGTVSGFAFAAGM